MAINNRKKNNLDLENVIQIKHVNGAKYLGVIILTDLKETAKKRLKIELNKVEELAYIMSKFSLVRQIYLVRYKNKIHWQNIG